LYKSLTQSDGKYVVVGEATSAHHAWVVGALESAVRGVYQFMWKHSKNQTANEVTTAYNNGEICGPFGPVPSEYDRTEDLPMPAGVNLKADAMPSPIGELARMQVLMESIRLKQGEDTIDNSKVTDDQIRPILDLLEMLGL
jgi:hypothetical protein